MKIFIKLFILISFASCNSNNSFELCAGNTHPYYHPILKYKGGFYEIKKYFYKNYRTSHGANNSGIIRIQFQVNCLGESGNYDIETYNLEYDDSVIDRKIMKQLVDLTKELTGWIPANNEEGNAVNSHKFFAFKIIDGQLKDILPK
ncbi:hypothetical protein AWE51_08725 [Aquimarina aggregata]|uniref:TonB C-terminal domain-containing protein n=1 Tax=Aquimarina aggregata TaxID=1642818 RepID=A0A162ZDD6_9FLAO|nr:hypothetical protein [Aquimarina aggregata]KZS39725.1 hypothetical protein AWE51_08725 [Aquimarina aggregata]